MMECDRISELPDSLLTQILLNLPTKDSVKTSVLSTRWRDLWLNVPGLDLEILDFDYPYEEDFPRFMDRFMEFNRGSHLQKFEIFYDECNIYRDRFMKLIDTLIDRGIQDLYVFMDPCKRDEFMCQNIYKSKILVSLKLVNVGLKHPEFVVSLPCLKIMLLSNVCYGKDGPLVVEKLISGCPVLEDLKLIRPFDILTQEVLMFLCVSSQTLKSLSLAFASVTNRSGTDFSVEIDAPRLKYMNIDESQSDSIVVKNLSSLFRIDICTKWNPMRPEKRNMFCDFLTAISSVRHMVILLWMLKGLYRYSKLGPIPIFHNLYHLKAEVSSSSLQLLAVFLESCPNLKNLILKYNVSKSPEEMDFTNVHRCLISTLEYVEIKKVEIGDENEIKLVNYFLENSAVLKKLTLRFTHSTITKQDLERYKKLLTSKKLSPTCQVIIIRHAADDEHCFIEDYSCLNDLFDDQ